MQADCESLLAEVSRLAEERDALLATIANEKAQWDAHHKVRGLRSAHLPTDLITRICIPCSAHGAADDLGSADDGGLVHAALQADVEALQKAEAAFRAEATKARAEAEAAQRDLEARARELQSWAASEDDRMAHAKAAIEDEEAR